MGLAGLDRIAERSHYVLNLPRRSLDLERTGEVCFRKGLTIVYVAFGITDVRSNLLNPYGSATLQSAALG